MSTFTNRLAHESSPYLLQHAHNPVDWYPWGPEALDLARREDRPILLSVGYSACHWCHVMARESFEDEVTAALLNEHFVSIKVDREERPELDLLYQTVCQLLTRAGGWPLTVFLTPDQEPFFAGTYFPPDRRYGRPGFGEVLLALADAYHQAREQVAEQARQLIEALREAQEASPPGELSADLVERAYRSLLPQFDRRHGGFGQAPKFPNPFNLELFLRHHAGSGDREALALAVQACRAMRAGGVYDQLGGGFHRYSVDAQWAVPHFEKMLYDNALLPPIYLAAWQATGDADLAAVVRETLDYLLAEMRSPAGGFYSTTDADSEGEEGKYFVWTWDEVHAALEASQAQLVCDRFGVTRAGNFEHATTVLSAAHTPQDLASARGWPVQQAVDYLDQARRKLLAVRGRRVAPQRDEKVLTAWNGLAIVAFARAGLALGEPRYVAAAAEAAGFLLRECRAGDRLQRVWKDGRATIDGYLDDYAGLACGLLALFAATGEPQWYHPAVELVETALREFGDPAVGDFFMTRADGEPLVLRPKEVHDSATPSGLSLVMHALVGLWRLTGEGRYRERAEQALRARADELHHNAWGSANLIAAAEALLAESESVVVVGDGPAAEALLRAATAAYRPHRLVCRRRPGDADEVLPALLHGRALRDGQPAAYVCQGFTCREPVTDPEQLV